MNMIKENVIKYNNICIGNSTLLNPNLICQILDLDLVNNSVHKIMFCNRVHLKMIGQVLQSHLNEDL